MKRILTLIMFAAIMIPGHTQRFLHLTSTHGLPDNHARFVFQDASGYVYVGTRNGLSKYDGYNFIIAELEDSISNLPKEFSAMIESAAGIFTIASTGIYEYNQYNNRLHLAKSFQVLDEACFVEYEQQVFCGNSAGLFQYEDQQWINKNFLLSGIEDIHVRTMLVTTGNELLLGTNKGLFRLDKNLELIWSDIGNDPTIHNINGILQDETGGFWVSTLSSLYYLDRTFSLYKNLQKHFENRHIRCIELDPEGRIWVGGEFGILIYHPADHTVQEIYRDISHYQGLNDNAVYSLFRDRADNMWVGTYFGGINLWNSTFDKFTSYYPGTGEGDLSGKVVREMQEDTAGNLWLALEDGGINYLDRKKGMVSRFFYEMENDYKNVHSLVLTGDSLWVGSFNTGLECYRIIRGKDGPQLLKMASYLEDKMIFALSKSRDGVLYIGAVDGIFMLEIASSKVRAYKEEVFGNRMIYNLESISEQELLAGTLRNGLYYCNLDKDLITAFSSEDEFVSMRNISSIHRVAEGEYAITSSSGLYKFSNRDKSLKCLLPTDGITEFRSVLLDGDGSYWISTTNGLNCFSEEGELLKKYNTYDGLPENQFNFNSAFKTSDGRMFFGTYNGLISFDPTRLKSFTHRVPEVRFTSYTVLDDDRTTLRSYFLDKLHREIRLKAYQSFLSLEFSTLGYTQSKDLNYEIRISGRAGSWDQMLSNRSVTFSHLSKGWHKVEVRPVSDGFIYGPLTELSIYRQPTLWQTTYAYVAYVLMLALAFLYIRREFFRRQDSRNLLAIERYEKENQKMLNDQKMRFFLNISHEFRTPLTIIGGTISNIIQKFTLEKDVREKLNTIQNNSENLNRLVNDFLDYGKLDSGFKPLKIKKQAVLPFIHTTCNMFDNWAEVNQLSYIKEMDETDFKGYFDPEKLERIIYNLLSNAFKFNSSGGSVLVNASIENGSGSFLKLMIKDTGLGIGDDLLAEIREHFNHEPSASLSQKSIGLAYTAGLVRQMGGAIEVESEMDLGTAFMVTIPVDKPLNDLIDGDDPLLLTDHSEAIHADQESRLFIKDNRKPGIFIVDDNLDLLEMLKDNLEPEYRVRVASSPKEALSKIIQQEFSLIICDIMMPEMNGFEVIEALQSNILTSHIPIIILTAAAEKNIEMKAYRKGAVSYLAKPFKNEELHLKIESILSFRRELISRFRSEHDLPAEEIVCSEKDEEFISKASDAVQDNMGNAHFDVHMFCTEMNVSRTLLHNKLKNISGLSTTEFIRTIRLKHAYMILKKDSLTVSEVALKCGFNDANYFSRCFKKKFGVHPSKISMAQ